MDTSRLMELILTANNLNSAYKRVVQNKGAAGVDGMGAHLCRVCSGHTLTVAISKERTVTEGIGSQAEKCPQSRILSLSRHSFGFRRFGINGIL